MGKANERRAQEGASGAGDAGRADSKRPAASAAKTASQDRLGGVKSEAALVGGGEQAPRLKMWKPQPTRLPPSTAAAAPAEVWARSSSSATAAGKVRTSPARAGASAAARSSTAPPQRSSTGNTEGTLRSGASSRTVGDDGIMESDRMVDVNSGDAEHSLYLDALELEMDACGLSELVLDVNLDADPLASFEGLDYATRPSLNASSGAAKSELIAVTAAEMRERLQQTHKRPAAFKQSESTMKMSLNSSRGPDQVFVRHGSSYGGALSSGICASSNNIAAGASTGDCGSLDLSHHIYGSSENPSSSDLACATPITSSAQLTQSDASSGLLSAIARGPRAVHRTASVPSGVLRGTKEACKDEEGLKAEYVRRRAERKKKLAASKERAKEKRVNSLRDAGEKAVAVIRDLTGTTAARSKNMSDAERAEMLYRRRIRNRESAVRSRERQRELLEGLGSALEHDVRDALAVLDRCSAALEEVRSLQLECNMAQALLACGSLSSPSCQSLRQQASSASAERIPSAAAGRAGPGALKPMSSTHSLPRTLKRNTFGSGSWSLGAGSDKWDNSATIMMMQDTDSHGSGSAGGGASSSARRLFSLQASRVLQGLSPLNVGSSPSNSARNAWANYSQTLLPGSISVVAPVSQQARAETKPGGDHL
mmetsp:Transcript_6931/g.18574  ORF Transcript_6931/g.18574 Transcript_6931/m.18574 type:complete len:655 (+) Transcript_6931:106-2070(+)|eukprot:CAMPEP_0185830116 /NCGR_PEP_ID=MMETSP1353-20130828/636_1 /TAXON_ID=1077150 /ORGANISM="Erythrolobus australicus, Strain CCMP3124" /LENGTH=654 /DNA_ID=CAMNT_0028527973 /DNA_START=101 /DNA_END=2065 /DNA_ORIENTATION=-